jgi:hypothetical protein
MKAWHFLVINMLVGLLSFFIGRSTAMTEEEVKLSRETLQAEMERFTLLQSKKKPFMSECVEKVHEDYKGRVVKDYPTKYTSCSNTWNKANE